MSTFSVRDAKREDCKEVRRLIQELADFERMPDRPKIDAKDLERDAFDENPPLFYCYVVDDPHDSSKIVGYAMYYYTYGSWTGRGMNLEDIFVTEAYRGKGVGNLLFKRVVQKALEMKCCDLNFIVLEWNPAQDFYKARGAINITEKDKWHLYRLHSEEMKKLAGNID